MGLLTIIRLSLVALLALVFVFAGSMKVTDQLDAKVHREMVTNFEKFNSKVFHFDEQFGLSAEQFRLAVGVTEIVCGLGLFFSTFAALVLMGVMGGAIFTHVMLEEPPVPPAVLLAVLTVMVLLTLVDRPSAGSASTTSSSKSSSKSSKRVKKMD